MNDGRGNGVSGGAVQVLTGQSLQTSVRLRETGRLAGDSVRSAVDEVSRHIMQLVDEAEGKVTKMRQDAETFCDSLKDIGEAHASRIESAIDELQTTHETIRRERERVIALTQQGDIR